MKKKELKAQIKELQDYIDLCNEILPKSWYLPRYISDHERNLIYKYSKEIYPIDIAVKNFDTIKVSELLAEYAKENLPTSSEWASIAIIEGHVYINTKLTNITPIPTRTKSIVFQYKNVNTDVYLEGPRVFSRKLTPDELELLRT